MIKFSDLLDSGKCHKMLRQHRWPDSVRCPHCGDAISIISRGESHRHAGRNRYQCNDCKCNFDDLSLSVFSGHHQPLKVWMHCLYLMSLNLSSLQIANELDLNKSDGHKMTEQLRPSVCSKKPKVKLSGEVEYDEVYIVAGHKGQPEQVKKKRLGRRNRLKGARGSETLAKEKPLIFGMIQRGGEVVIKMLANVKKTTIEPIIKATVADKSLIFTDEYGDGFYEIHENLVTITLVATPLSRHISGKTAFIFRLF